jgi:hypothetical protein
MKNYLSYFMVVLTLTLALGTSGCRSTGRSRTIFAGDHNVTIVRKPNRKAIKRSPRVVRSTKYNRAIK